MNRADVFALSSMNESELVDFRHRCPICGSEKQRRRLALLQPAGPVHLLSCAACGGSSASRMPGLAILNSGLGVYFDPDHRKVGFDKMAILVRHLLRIIPGDGLGENPRILDFGGGDGPLAMEFSKALIQRRRIASARIVRVDLETWHGKAPAGITFHQSATLDSVEGEFDLVLAGAVLEHVAELGKVLRKLFSLTAGGGLFYGRTPYLISSPTLKKVDVKFPHHMHDLGRSFWNRLPETFGLKAAVIHSTPGPVESAFSSAPLSTATAHLKRVFASVENRMVGKKKQLRCKGAGSWESLIRFAGN